MFDLPNLPPSTLASSHFSGMLCWFASQLLHLPFPLPRMLFPVFSGLLLFLQAVTRPSLTTCSWALTSDQVSSAPRRGVCVRLFMLSPLPRNAPGGEGGRSRYLWFGCTDRQMDNGCKPAAVSRGPGSGQTGPQSSGAVGSPQGEEVAVKMPRSRRGVLQGVTCAHRGSPGLVTTQALLCPSSSREPGSSPQRVGG